MSAVDTAFKDWVVLKVDYMSDDEKQKFLRLLKTDPQKAEELIKVNMEPWSLQAAMQLKSVIVVSSFQDAPKELVDYLKEYFSKEIETIE